ncbi:ATP-binding protein [Streptomyces sp. A3M-1-3]|uniref:ATP-binding protein n=1 Tax=Streptomyces sp. A3M-1-3 TaxID=2962044 RepID=UPI0020B6F192|nr:ATP-binding protein [Streptomyces sp. A3M-1-3]MCP3819905.1 ATP-binding protein [Streptomyces sp. A3M-1-3]
MNTVSPHAPWSYVLQLPHDPRAPRVARKTLRAVLGGHGMGELLDTAELLACELVTNAYRHSAGPAMLRLRHMDGGWLRISVWDSNPVIPAPFDKPPGALRPVPARGPADRDGGRGLLLVRLCADNWGGYPLGEDLFGRGGKLLWFELGPGRPEPAHAA